MVYTTNDILPVKYIANIVKHQYLGQVWDLSPFVKCDILFSSSCALSITDVGSQHAIIYWSFKNVHRIEVKPVPQICYAAHLFMTPRLNKDSRGLTTDIQKSQWHGPPRAEKRKWGRLKKRHDIAQDLQCLGFKLEDVKNVVAN